MAGCSLKPDKITVDDIVNCYEKSFIDSKSDAGLVEVNGVSLLQSTDVLTRISGNSQIDAVIIFNHCISDIYAAGGIPKSVSSIIGMQRSCPDIEYYRMFASKISEISSNVGVTVTGGHTFYVDREVLLGFSVLGLKNEFNKISLQNSEDVIFITKPIGTGYIFQDKLWLQEVSSNALEIMCSSNSIGAEIFYLVTSMTDISGYGLVGHLMNLLSKDNMAILYGDDIPVYEISDLTKPSKQALDNFVEFSSKVFSNKNYNFIYDNQTNGGLLFTVKPTDVDLVKFIFSEKKLPLFRIGHVERRENKSNTRVYVR